jgi:hypothetical protein
MMAMHDESQGVSYRMVLMFIVLALACAVVLAIAISMGYEHVRNSGNQPSDYEKALRPHSTSPEKEGPPESTNPPTAFPAP